MNDLSTALYSLDLTIILLRSRSIFSLNYFRLMLANHYCSPSQFGLILLVGFAMRTNDQTAFDSIHRLNIVSRLAFIIYLSEGISLRWAFWLRLVRFIVEKERLIKWRGIFGFLIWWLGSDNFRIFFKVLCDFTIWKFGHLVQDFYEEVHWISQNLLQRLTASQSKFQYLFGGIFAVIGHETLWNAGPEHKFTSFVALWNWKVMFAS